MREAVLICAFDERPNASGAAVLMDAVDVVNIVLDLVFAGAAFWMLQGAVRRDRKWLRWQVLL